MATLYAAVTSCSKANSSGAWGEGGDQNESDQALTLVPKQSFGLFTSGDLLH